MEKKDEVDGDKWRIWKDVLFGVLGGLYKNMDRLSFSII